MMEKRYELHIDPRILELLGPNLYTNIYYVLAELIANAYDAMAHNVYIIVNKDDITVEDDGKGMSYAKGEVEHFLDVAKESRVTEADAMTEDGKRRKMGRKGIGKLAALSVSENVLVKTRQNGECSGFVLSRYVSNSRMLEPIPDAEISFQKITGSGTAIVMQAPQYHLHKTIAAVKRNLLNIFPAVDADFRIHVIRGSEEVVIDSFETEGMKDLCAVVAYGEEFAALTEKVMDGSPWRDRLVFRKGSLTEPLVMVDKFGKEHEHTLEVKGWIGAYKTTRNRKAEIRDFPDNFISLYANNKMGEFNILPTVGQNKLNEAFVVGQLHVDLFELTELPDMALSNRQGYKAEDPRYQAVLARVREEILPEVLRLREVFADLKNEEKKRQKEAEQRAREALLKERIEEFRRSAAQSMSEALRTIPGPLTLDGVGKAFDAAINKTMPNLGIKAAVDAGKRKILISQTEEDKPIADVVYKMLLHNGVRGEDIIYTNCDEEVAWVPEGRKIYEYLREFFVESYSTQKIYVLFVTSKNTKASWGALTEVGAAWITQIDNKIFNVAGFRPEHPLDDESQWHTTHRRGNRGQDIWMDEINATLFCRKIEDVCDKLGYTKQSREENQRYLRTLIAVR